jgi:hypothetical protein
VNGDQPLSPLAQGEGDEDAVKPLSAVTRGEGGEACRWLRSRSAYGHRLDDSPWETGDSGLESYWCLCTMEAAGPDDGLVHAQACREGRRCFAPRE